MFLEEVQETPSFDFSKIDWKGLWNSFVKWSLTTGVKIIIAIVIIFVSFKIINFISRKISKRIAKKSVDKTIETVLLSIFRKGSKIIILLILMGYLGIETTGLAAIFASAGLGIGLAVQGSLSKFAGGVLILLTRPFRIGDFIEVGALCGTVENIDLIYTKVVTPDNKVISIPNGNLSNSSIINYSMKDIRRLDMEFSISYSDDYSKAEKVILGCVKKSGLALESPEPFINIIRHNTSSIDIVARVWVKKDDYWNLNFILLESVKTAFDKAGITIPFPQVDVNKRK